MIYYFKFVLSSLQPIAVIYITSPILGPFDIIAELHNNIIKTSCYSNCPYGYMTSDQPGTHNDCFDLFKVGFEGA